MSHGLSFVVEEGPCVLSFDFLWKQDSAPETDEERRAAVLTALDALYREITRPWLKTSLVEPGLKGAR